jgi:transposase InsO family protein
MNLRLHETAEKIATEATLRAVRILARALDSQLQSLRVSDDALTRALARIKELETRNGILTEMVETFQTRLRKIAPRKRPHYSGPARFKALQLRQAMG